MNHEPNAGGFNLPANVTQDQIDALCPDGRTCGECVNIRDVCCDFGYCSLALASWSGENPDADAESVAEWVAGHLMDMQEDTCAEWRG